MWCAETQSRICQAMLPSSSDVFVSFSTFPMEQKTKNLCQVMTPQDQKSPHTQKQREEETTGTPGGRASPTREEGIYEPSAQPKSALWSKATAVGIVHPSTDPRRPGSPASPPPARGAQRPLGSWHSAGRSPATGVPCLRAHPLLRCPAPGCRRARTPRGPKSWHPLLP